MSNFSDFTDGVRPIVAAASGAIAAGAPMVLNSNGTFSAVTGAAESLGALTNISTASLVNGSFLMRDPVSGRFVAIIGVNAYVGTVSGTGISWTAAQATGLTSDSRHQQTGFYEPVSGKFIVVQTRGQASEILAVVGTLSGTTISFAAPVTIASGVTIGTSSSSGRLSSGVAPSNGIFAVAFYSGTQARVFPFKFSGGSFSAGSNTTLNNSSAGMQAACIFHPSNGNLIVGFPNFSNANVVMYSVNTSSLELTYQNDFTIPSTFNDARFGGIQFDASSGAFLAALNSSGTNGQLTSFTATATTLTQVTTQLISGNVQSFGTNQGTSLRIAGFDSTSQQAVVAWSFNTGSTNIYRYARVSMSSGGSAITLSEAAQADATATFTVVGIDVALDSAAKVVYMMPNSATSITASKVIQTAYTNLTAADFVGLASASAADGASVRSVTQGNLASGLSSLTAGTQYFVASTGGLSTTAGSPSVVAGVALSSSTLLVKG